MEGWYIAGQLNTARTNDKDIESTRWLCMILGKALQHSLVFGIEGF
jgi:hypothetical protein